MSTRRDFVQGLAVALGGHPAWTPVASPIGGTATPGQASPPLSAVGSDVGSLDSFIRSQVVRGEFPLSYLRAEFQDVPQWKERAPGKLRARLHADPPGCEPRPEVVARVDRDGYVCETVLFNTTPELRVPASVLVPKGLTRPAPAVVALHDHGGMYFWGREKVVE